MSANIGERESRAAANRLKERQLRGEIEKPHFAVKGGGWCFFQGFSPSTIF
jgi:hypothetical protein